MRNDTIGIFLSNKLRSIVKDLIHSIGNVICIVVFGSFVKKYFSTHSDIDIAVILRDFKGIDSSHELFNNRILEITFIGEKTFLNMINQSHPFILNILFNGIPLYGEEWFNKVKAQITKPNTENWIKKYLSEAISKLREATNMGDVISALILTLNAYLLSKGIFELSYSIDKLIKKIHQDSIIDITKKILTEKNVEEAKRSIEELMCKLQLPRETL